jgi:mannose-1-phosphate guanylyltransferase
MHANVWGIVLAAGDGRRMESVTRDASGRVVPKQYFRLGDGPSLLARTFERALPIVPRERLVTIVARQHRDWWESELADFPPANIIIQPENRGTAVGILLPLTHVLHQDPDAVVVVFPSDHHVADESVMRKAVLEGIEEVHEHPDEMLLLGITPDYEDAEYGWVTPRPVEGDPVSLVETFVEKPAADVALRLRDTGALWNSFMFVAHGSTMLDIIRKRMHDTVEAVKHAIDSHEALGALYAGLETHDFSREILQTFPARLRLLTVPPCGWTDLGTPARFARIHAEQQG